MGEFAISVATTYQTGAARGDYSILSAMDVRDHELFIAFGQSINDLILRHRKDLETKRETVLTNARDVESVVRSMLNFHRATGVHLARNEEEAYRYWLRTVNACLTAERAYGSNAAASVTQT
jgi:hypothetical protein